MDHLVWLEIAEEPIANNGSSTFLHFSNPISLVLYLYRPIIALGILVCGEQVVNATMEGVGFIRRHDSIKLELKFMATYCGLSSVYEPYGLFGSLLPQRPLNRLQYGSTDSPALTEMSRTCHHQK